VQVRDLSRAEAVARAAVSQVSPEALALQQVRQARLARQPEPEVPDERARPQVAKQQRLAEPRRVAAQAVVAQVARPELGAARLERRG